MLIDLFYRYIIRMAMLLCVCSCSQEKNSVFSCTVHTLLMPIMVDATGVNKRTHQAGHSVNNFGDLIENAIEIVIILSTLPEQVNVPISLH